MSEHFDAVVVGSGFGGSVMAGRLAEAKLNVCLLERGQAYPPGSFPRAPHEMKANFWDPSAALHGLFNVWSFPGAGALVSSALGGGSHIYANVLIRKDEHWFFDADRPWPVTRAELDPHYDAVERMLNAQKYPLDKPPFDRTLKTHAMREAGAQLGLEWLLPNLAVSFRQRAVTDPEHPDDTGNPALFGAPLIEEHENLHKAMRTTCRLCGECDIGCNFGSKNTLDFNYLSSARRHGAQLRTLCEVRSFDKQQDGRYHIEYVQHSLGAPSKEAKPVTITADRLILAAGTFGSTYLLLKNRVAFPRLSPALGTRYSGNGDLLSFIMNARKPLNPTYGPVITSAIRVENDGDLGGFYVEDGGFPVFLAWIVENALDLPGFAERALHFGKRTIYGALGLDPDADLGNEVSHLIGPAKTASHSLPILTMGRDTPSGKLTLNGKFLECDWNIKKSAAYYDRLIETGKRIAETMGAQYQHNPGFEYFKQVMTAHPLGGCPMGTNRDEGVVNSYGEVFEYPGLYVTDGAVLPGPVGPNPALTIAALADRAATHIIETKGAGQ